MRHPAKLHWKKTLVPTLLLILWVAVSSFWAAGKINQFEEDAGFRLLRRDAEKLAYDLETSISQNQTLLELIASELSTSSDLTSPGTAEILRSNSADGFLSRLELLLPGDLLLTADGQQVQVSGLISFQNEASQGIHISDREMDWRPDGGYVLRHYVPVVQSGETAALLCGVIELEGLQELQAYQPYDGEAAIYIIDGATGDLLLDTWHETLGNLWALGERPLAPGYDHEQLRQGLIDGKSGYVVFTSSTTGEYLYFYYTPMKINAWQMALSVPEDAVFADAQAVRGILNQLLVLGGIGFALYFLWMLYYVRWETSERQRRLDTIHDIYNVAQMLFNAHEEQEKIAGALTEIERILSAERVSFWMRRQMDGQELFRWQGDADAPLPTPEQTASAGRLLAFFEAGNPSFLAAHPGAVRALLPEADQVRSMAAVPVVAGDEGLCGILVACNLSLQDSTVALLKSLGICFSMLYRNLTSYHSMKRLGERDLLTGLYNRNRYERDLPAYGQCRTSLGCIYVDANGLHELNNRLGHDAGDEMLRTVAAGLLESFDSQRIYRIGGDEFVAFAADLERAETENLARKFSSRLDAQGIHVSVGVQWEQSVSSIEALVKGAEQRMYEDKRAYYSSGVHDRRRPQQKSPTARRDPSRADWPGQAGG